VPLIQKEKRAPKRRKNKAERLVIQTLVMAINRLPRRRAVPAR
jgi:hypothetical protein